MVTFKTKDKDKLRLVSQQSIDLPENMKADSCISACSVSQIVTYEREKLDDFECGRGLGVFLQMIYRWINQARKLMWFFLWHFLILPLSTVDLKRWCLKRACAESTRKINVQNFKSLYKQLRPGAKIIMMGIYFKEIHLELSFPHQWCFRIQKFFCSRSVTYLVKSVLQPEFRTE